MTQKAWNNAATIKNCLWQVYKKLYQTSAEIKIGLNGTEEHLDFKYLISVAGKAKLLQWYWRILNI